MHCDICKHNSHNEHKDRLTGFNNSMKIIKPTELSVPNTSLITQSLYRTQPPTTNGLIVGEEPGRGSQRAMQPGRCVNFDGVNDYINCGSDLITTGDFTVSCWVNFATTTEQRFWGQGTPTGSNLFGVSTIRIGTTGVIMVWLNNGSGSGLSLTAGAAAPLANTWYHFAVSCTRSSTGRVYVNGVGGTGVNIASKAGTLKGLFALGRYGSSPIYANCRMSDFQILPRALSESEIQQLHQLGCDALPNEPRTAWWKLDEQHPTTAFDSSGNSRHGTLTNVNATVGNFFYEGDDVPHSYQNDKGYSERVNQLGFSEDFSVSEWSQLRTTVSRSSQGWKMADDSTGGTIGHGLASGVIVPSGLATISAYFKAGEYSWASLVDMSSARVAAWFDLSNGTVYSEAGTWVISGSAKIESAGDGWYRCSVSFNAPAAAQTFAVSMSPDISGHSVYGGRYVGTEGAGLFVDKLQVNYGLLLPYQKTSVPRASGEAIIASPGTIPRNEADKGKDTMGNALQCSGKCPRNAQLVQSNCFTGDGVDDFINIGPSGNLVTDGDFTVMARCQRASSAVHPICGFGNPASAGGRGFILYMNASSLYVQIRAGDSAGNATGATFAWQTGKWYHIAASVERATGVIKFYVDGTLHYIGDISSMSKSTLANGDFFVGRYGAYENYYATFPMCDFQFFDSVLSEADVAKVAASQTPSVAPKTHLPMAEGAGDKVYDISPNALHGTITNADLVTCWSTKQSVFHHNAAKGFSHAENRFNGSASLGLASTSWSTYSPANGERTPEQEFFDGTNTAVLLNDTSGTGYYGVNQPVFSTHLPAGTYTLSVYVKKGTSDTIGIWMFRNMSSNIQGPFDCDWVAGVPVPRVSATGMVVTDEGNGWFRLSGQFMLSGTETAVLYLLPCRTLNTLTGSTYFAHPQLTKTDVRIPYYPSPLNVRYLPHNIPAKSLTLDALDVPLTHPAGRHLPLCESKIDFTQGVASPDSAGVPTALDPAASPSNPVFRRLRTKGDFNVAVDRLVRYQGTITGQRLAAVQKFTQTKEA